MNFHKNPTTIPFEKIKLTGKIHKWDLKITIKMIVNSLDRFKIIFFLCYLIKSEEIITIHGILDREIKIGIKMTLCLIFFIK